MGRAERDKLAIRERDGEGPIQSFLAGAAAKHGVWVIAGTVPLFARRPGAGAQRVARLRRRRPPRRPLRQDPPLRLHRRGRAVPGVATRSSRATTPVAIDSPFGRLALSICYDVRFPELYRRLAPMDLITVPSAFTATTGAAHWEILLRARAVENLAWVIAPAQGGEHANGRRTHGHSMIVDPWGGWWRASPAAPGLWWRKSTPTLRTRCARACPRSGTACYDEPTSAEISRYGDHADPGPASHDRQPAAARALRARSAAAPAGVRRDHDPRRRLRRPLLPVPARPRPGAWRKGIVKSGSFNIDQGVGVRAIAGEKTAFAYSDEISLAALKDAAGATRAIARLGGRSNLPVARAGERRRLYPALDPLASLGRHREGAAASSGSSASAAGAIRASCR